MTYTWIRATTSQVIATSPACVGAVLVTGTAVGVMDFCLYDGQGDKDPPILTIKSSTYDTKHINFTPYLVTQRGLYVKFGTNVSEVIVQLGWEHE